MSEKYGWAIKRGKTLFLSTIRDLRRDCISDEVEHWNGEPWEYLSKKCSLRCVKVTVQELEGFAS